MREYLLGRTAEGALGVEWRLRGTAVALADMGPLAWTPYTGDLAGGFASQPIQRISDQ